jgi:hypothetical protein
LAPPSEQRATPTGTIFSIIATVERTESSVTDCQSSYQGEGIMPRIVRFHEVGGPELLQIEEEKSKQPGIGHRIRLKVQAVGLNRAESMFIRGQYVERPKLPAGVGYEAADVVEAVGPDVDKSWVGKLVATIPSFSMND